MHLTGTNNFILCNLSCKHLSFSWLKHPLFSSIIHLSIYVFLSLFFCRLNLPWFKIERDEEKRFRWFSRQKESSLSRANERVFNRTFFKPKKISQLTYSWAKIFGVFLVWKNWKWTNFVKISNKSETSQWHWTENAEIKNEKKNKLDFFFSKNGRVRWHEMRLKQPWCVKKWSFKNTTEKYISLLDFFHSSSSLVVWPVFGSLFQRFLNWHRTIFDVRAKSVSLARSEQKKKKEKKWQMREHRSAI